MEDSNVADGFDTQDILARIQQGVQDHKRVVAKRASAKEMSRALHDTTSLLEATVESNRVRACLALEHNPQSTYQWFPREDTLGDADMRIGEDLVTSFLRTAAPEDTNWLDTNPTRSPNAWAFRFVARCTHTVIDNLSAISALLALESHVRSTVTLARSALEAAATGFYVIDVRVTPKERLRRILNLRLEEVQEQWNSDRGSDAEPQSAQLLDELSAFAEHSGFRVQRPKGPTYRPPKIAGPPGHSDAARQLVEDVLPGFGKKLWRSMSGVAHSRYSASVYAAEYSLPHTMKPWQRTESTARHSAPTILATQEFFRRIEAYFGWQFDHWPTLFDRLIACFMSGAGLHDDEIRKKLGLQRPT